MSHELIYRRQEFTMLYLNYFQ